LAHVSFGVGLLSAWLFGTFLPSVTNAAPRPVVVELFTSEGCSSCPPADAYVGELAKRSDVLALAFHVDYWDDLGWRDRFGLSQSVERQRRYAGALRLSTVYTPEVVIDGRADYVGSNRSAIGQALEATRDGVPVSLTIEQGAALISLAAPSMASSSMASSSTARGGDIVLIAYRRKAVSAIGRGENAGRTLEEYNIVRALRDVGHWSGAAQDFRVPLASLPQDTTDIAVLVQAPGQGAVLGAATRAISSP
jgi:hypothetical protein